MKKDNTTTKREPTTLARRDFLAGAALTLVAVTAIGAQAARADETAQRYRPEGAPDSARCCSYDCEGLSLVTWADAPLSEGDLAVVETRDENAVGIYRPGPDGRVTLESNGEPSRRTFRPSDVLTAARVMHIECGGSIVARFPLAEGGAR